MKRFLHAALGQVEEKAACPVFEFEQFYEQKDASDDVAPARSIVWAVIFSVPFWIVVGLIFLHFKN